MPSSRSRFRSPLVPLLRFSDCTGPRRVDRRLTCSPWLPYGRPCVPETALTTSAIVLTAEVFGKHLVVRPVKNGDARLKHTATEKTAAVPVAEAESTKVLPRSALRHRGESLEKPPRGMSVVTRGHYFRRSRQNGWLGTRVRESQMTCVRVRVTTSSEVVHRRHRDEKEHKGATKRN